MQRLFKIDLWRSMLKDTYFQKTLLAIGIPVIIQNAISSSLNLVDVLMIGSLGKNSISGVGLANQYFFIYVLLLFGINSGAGVYIAQFWGKGDTKSVHKTLGVALAISLLASGLFGLLAGLLPELCIRLFSKDTATIAIGANYLRIICWTFPLTALSFALSQASRSVGNAKLPMMASATSLIVNTTLNYLLIFGVWGFPELGVAGAAWATVIARAVEASLMLVATHHQSNPLSGGISAYFSFDFKFVKSIMTTSFPVILNEFLWSVGVSLYVLAYARSGTDAYTAVQISQTVDKLFFVVAFGIGSAGGVMIGNALGEGNRERAIQYAWYLNGLSLFFGLLLGALLILISPLVVQFFNVGSAIQADAVWVMRVMGLFMAFKMCNALQIIGTLRGGGDTTYALMMEIGSVYFVGVPMAFIGTTLLQWPIYWVVALVCLEEAVKSIFGFSRLISAKWANNLVSGH